MSLMLLLLVAGAESKFDAYFKEILGIWGKKPGGGLTLKGKIAEPAHFVFQSCLVVPSIWQSFIQIGEMACITPAWSSGKLGLKLITSKYPTKQ